MLIGSQETNQNYIDNDFSVMQKSGSGAEESQKANGRGSISLFTADWPVASVDCPSALWHHSPIFAGFGNDSKNIWALEKKAFNPAAETEEAQEPGAGWPSGGAGVLTLAHRCVGRQHWYKKINKCHILFDSALDWPAGFIWVCVDVCLCAVQL